MKINRAQCWVRGRALYYGIIGFSRLKVDVAAGEFNRPVALLVAFEEQSMYFTIRRQL